MDISSSIASTATLMKQTEVMNNIGTKMLKKSMEAMQTQGQDIVEMAQQLPKFNGEIGSLLDVRA